MAEQRCDWNAVNEDGEPQEADLQCNEKECASQAGCLPAYNIDRWQGFQIWVPGEAMQWDLRYWQIGLWSHMLA